MAARRFRKHTGWRWCRIRSARSPAISSRSRVGTIRSSSRISRLLSFPDFGPHRTPAGIGPDSVPIATIRAIERQSSVAAGTVGNRDEILIADARADKAYIADHPGHAKSISGLFNRNGTGVLGATARIVALDAVRA